MLEGMESQLWSILGVVTESNCEICESETS